MKILPCKKIEDAINILAKDADVYAPLIRGQMSGYYKWMNDDEDELVMQTVNTYMSPKNALIPQAEKVIAFKKEGTDLSAAEVAEKTRDRVIFGIKACDLKSIEYLDMMFLTKGYEDEFYKIRREKTTIIARACYVPGAACFCESMGIDRVNVDADVIIHDIGSQDYVWEIKTAKGEAATAKISSLLEERDADLPKVQPLKKKVDITGVSEKLKGMVEHQMWEDMSSRCSTCGVCTNVCPTCYCFDIQVKVWGDEGYTFSCWDTCLYRKYTMAAEDAGINKKDRLRNRIMHKLEFFNNRYGSPMCTGCGRCVAMCQNMSNITDVINKIHEV